MVSGASPTNVKREKSIPVKITIDPRPAPTTLPPVQLTAQPKFPKKNQLLPKEKKQPNRITAAVKKPVHEWSEEKRRKLMWWLVSGSMIMIIIGWLAVIQFEIPSKNTSTFFTEAKNLFKNFHVPGTPKKSAAEKEIQQLDNQVFPQFNQ